MAVKECSDSHGILCPHCEVWFEAWEMNLQEEYTKRDCDNCGMVFWARCVVTYSYATRARVEE